jgi:hypothetical protein
MNDLCIISLLLNRSGNTFPGIDRGNFPQPSTLSNLGVLGRGKGYRSNVVFKIGFVASG